MKLKLDIKKIYLVMAERGKTAIYETCEVGQASAGVLTATKRL